MQVLIYLRKSREDLEKERRTGEDILATHRNRLVSLCERYNHDYTIKEEVVSGDTIAGRPVFQEVLYNLFPSGKYQGVCVNEISRLGRGNMKDAGEIYQAIIDCNIKIITPHKIYDPTNRSDLRQIRFELFLSREEFEMIKDRLTDGRDAAARAGRAAINLYTLGITSVRGQYVVVEKDLELARSVFTMVRDGIEFTTISNHLNALGHKTCRNKPWTATSVRELIKNVHYEGYQRWKGDLVKAEHGPLLPMELIYGARARLFNRDTHTTIRNKQFWVPLFCAKCGKRMYGANLRYPYKDKAYVYPTYTCFGKWDKPVCRNNVRARIIHDEVVQHLWTVVNDKQVQEELLKHKNGDNVESIVAEIKRLKTERTNKENRLKQIKMDYIAGIIDSTDYKEAKEILNNQIKLLDYRINELEPNTRKVNKSPQQIIEELKGFLLSWDMLEDSVKAEVVQAYTQSVTYDNCIKTIKTELRLPE